MMTQETFKQEHSDIGLSANFKKIGQEKGQYRKGNIKTQGVGSWQPYSQFTNAFNLDKN